ncbi:MAG: Rpn family recombination-promoting nuclease/putative transposase [Hespellia sp.]|nr:Rpn family recombination-promoting nuclease/putative transposase [Hespellia sp.]
MGTKDNVINPFLSKPERFADVVNHGSFQGKKLIDPKKLTELDSTGKGSTKIARDIKKLYNGKMKVAVIGIENQNNIHYAMPMRIWEYDVNEYREQLKGIRTRHEKEKDLKGDEWLSRFSKDDKLIPVLTQVVYYGIEPWDGPKSIYEMLDMPEELKPYQTLIGNYGLNLLEVNKIEDLDSYDDDLKMVFGFVKYQKDKEKLEEFVTKNRKLFENVPLETSKTIEVMANVKGVHKYMEEKTSDEGSVNMCEALQEMREEARLEGERNGERKGTLALIETCQELGQSREETLEKVKTKLEITDTMAEEYMKKYWK